MKPPGFAILGYAKFATRNTNEKIVRGRKTNETGDFHFDAILTPVDFVIQSVMPSKRLSEEWGVRS